MTKLIGYFSQQAVDAGYGSSYYLREDGQRVEVTMVFSANTEDTYRWPDKKFVGIVTTEVGVCRKSALTLPRVELGK